MTPEQSALIAKAREIRSRFPKWAEEANQHGLKVLAREYDWLGNQLEIAIDTQTRTLEKASTLQGWAEPESPTNPEKGPQERTLEFGELGEC
jgi:hypothetical protein